MQIVDIGADKYHASLLLEADVFFPGLFIHSLPPRALFRDLYLLLPSSERPRRRSDVTCATRKWTRRSTASSQREVGSVAPARPGLAAWSHAAGAGWGWVAAGAGLWELSWGGTGLLYCLLVSDNCPASSCSVGGSPQPALGREDCQAADVFPSVELWHEGSAP